MIFNMKKIWKKIDSEEYFNNIKIPNTWKTLEDFVNWYLDCRMPMMIPWDSEVIVTDDAAAISLFRKHPYQVELYLIHPKKFVPRHAHPELEVITMYLDGGKSSKPNKLRIGSNWGLLYDKISNDETHGGTTSTQFSQGYCLIAFEKWPENLNITSAAVQWRGELAGPIQEKLIKKYYPHAQIDNNFADVTLHNATSKS